MTKEASKKSKEVVCTFDKRMDTAECIKVETEVLNSLRHTEFIVFDLKGVEYIASSFLRICGKSAQKVDRGNFKIINASASVSKVFKIAGLSDILNVS